MVVTRGCVGGELSPHKLARVARQAMHSCNRCRRATHTHHTPRRTLFARNSSRTFWMMLPRLTLGKVLAALRMWR